MSQYTPEQVRGVIANMRVDGQATELPLVVDMLRAYAATLRQPAARADEETRAIIAADESVWALIAKAEASGAAADEGDEGKFWTLTTAAFYKLHAALSAQPAPKPAPDKHATGVYHKFNVTRTDGSDQPGGKHEGCDYFVLDMTHDPFAKPAAVAYADACEAKYPLLAVDMRRRYGLPAPERQGESFPMTEKQVRQWIDACNSESARQVLRDYLRLRTHPAAPVGVPDALYRNACEAVESWKACALKAEEVSDRLMAEINNMTGPMFMGEPVLAKPAPDVNAMVDRFLGWRLPADFAPDNGISYTPIPRHPGWTHDTHPVGTNLFTSAQAKAMFEYVLAAAPSAPQGTQQGEGAARELYNASVGDAHNLHCRAWSELSAREKQEWAHKASTHPERK